MTDGVDGPAARQDPSVAHPAARAEVASHVASRDAGQEPPGETTHWTAPAMARQAASASVRCSASGAHMACSRIGSRQFKLSNDPQFAAKLRDIVGLYVDPPAHAVVLSVDEKSQIQALDRTQPGLPMKKGRCGTMTHDYIRQRHHHTVCRAQRAGWQRDRPLHAAASPPGVHPLPQRHRDRRASRQTDPCHRSTITPPTSIRRSAPGWAGIRVGRSTLRPPPPLGSMLSRASSPR